MAAHLISFRGEQYTLELGAGGKIQVWGWDREDEIAATRVAGTPMPLLEVYLLVLERWIRDERDRERALTELLDDDGPRERFRPGQAELEMVAEADIEDLLAGGVFGAPEELYRWLAEHGTAGRVAVAFSIGPSEQLLIELARSGEPAVVDALIQNQYEAEEAVRAAVARCSWLQKAQMLAGLYLPDLPANVREEVREELQAIAKGEGGVDLCSSDLLEMAKLLPSDFSNLVLGNPNFSNGDRVWMGRYGDVLMRQAVALDPRIPEHLMRELAEDKDRGVRLDLTFNGAVPDSLLEELTKDQAQDVSQSARKRLRERRRVARQKPDAEIGL